MTATNVTFSENAAQNGGGSYTSQGSNREFTECKFLDNYASNQGGQYSLLFSFKSSPLIKILLRRI